MRSVSVAVALPVIRAPSLCPDAIVITQAMKAATIPEIFFDGSGVRVELEIGVADLPAFRNLRPDEIVERMGLPAQPPEQRPATFFEND